MLKAQGRCLAKHCFDLHIHYDLLVFCSHSYLWRRPPFVHVDVLILYIAYRSWILFCASYFALYYSLKFSDFCLYVGRKHMLVLESWVSESTLLFSWLSLGNRKYFCSFQISKCQELWWCGDVSRFDSTRCRPLVPQITKLEGSAALFYHVWRLFDCLPSRIR